MYADAFGLFVFGASLTSVIMSVFFIEITTVDWKNVFTFILLCAIIYLVEIGLYTFI